MSLVTLCSAGTVSLPHEPFLPFLNGDARAHAFFARPPFLTLPGLASLFLSGGCAQTGIRVKMHV